MKGADRPKNYRFYRFYLFAIPFRINFPLFAGCVMRNGAVFSIPNGYCFSPTDILRSIYCNVCCPSITAYTAAGLFCGTRNYTTTPLDMRGVCWKWKNEKKNIVSVPRN